jgi:hypothetical protein
MDQELQRYYEARFSTIATEGWSDLMEDTKALLDSVSSVPDIKGVEDLYFKQGQIDILNWLLNLKAISEQAYEELS